MEQPEKCPFCKPSADDIVTGNDLCYARWDQYPANRGHLLLVPFRHSPYFFSLTDPEKQALIALIGDCREILAENFRSDGYNIGMNVGAAAGQTVLHCHCHMIPRYAGDVNQPNGGIRRILPGK